MKKFLFVAVLAVASVMAYAQPRAIGGRLGTFEGVSYQHGLGENNMVEIELGYSIGGAMNGATTVKASAYGAPKDYRYTWGFTGYNIQAAATYDWIDPFGKKFPWEHKGEWHWYMGVGGAAGYGWHDDANFYYENKYVGWDWIHNWGFIGAVGRFGVEYDFWFPLQLSVDYRPVLGVGMASNPMYDSKMPKLMAKTQAGFYWQVYDIALSVRYKF